MRNTDNNGGSPPASRLQMPGFLVIAAICFALMVGVAAAGKQKDIDGDGIPDSAWTGFTTSYCDNGDPFNLGGKRLGCDNPRTGTADTTDQEPASGDEVVK